MTRLGADAHHTRHTCIEAHWLPSSGRTRFYHAIIYAYSLSGLLPRLRLPAYFSQACLACQCLGTRPLSTSQRDDEEAPHVGQIPIRHQPITLRYETCFSRCPGPRRHCAVRSAWVGIYTATNARHSCPQYNLYSIARRYLSHVCPSLCAALVRVAGPT